VGETVGNGEAPGPLELSQNDDHLPEMNNAIILSDHSGLGDLKYPAIGATPRSQTKTFQGEDQYNSTRFDVRHLS